MRLGTSLQLFTTLYITLQSCGTDSGSTPAQEPKLSETNTTYQLASRDDLAECDKSRLNWLVYLMDEEIFLGCDGSMWNKIDIEKETKVTEQITKSSPTPDENIWKDSYSGKTWHLLGKKRNSPYFTQDQDKCKDAGLTLPSLADFYDAIENGLWTHYADVGSGSFYLAFHPHTAGHEQNIRILNLNSGIPSVEIAYTKHDNGTANERWTIGNNLASVYCYK